MSLPQIKKELQYLKMNLNYLAKRIQSLEAKVSSLSESEKIKEEKIEPKEEQIKPKEPEVSTLVKSELPSGIEENIPLSISNREVKIPPSPPFDKEGNKEGFSYQEAAEKDMEVNFGRFWLNRIGIIVFTLGIGFLISYSFRYFGAFFKIMSGYLVCGGLFLLGVKLEKKDKFVHYGRVLLGGSWAIAYFTTYAMSHFPASRIINSEFLDLLLLGVVSLGMIAHSLKYKSEELAAVSIFTGYLTATMGDVTYFTFFSCLFLAITILVLVYKMQWVKMIFLGIIFTYLTHSFWVIRHIYSAAVAVGSLSVLQVYRLTDLAFLSIYWFIFTIGIHLIRAKDASVCNKLAGANFFNFLFFFFMAYPRLIKLYPNGKFEFLFGLGIVYVILAFLMNELKNNKLFVNNITIAVSLLTLSIPCKFIAYHTSIIWLIEIPFLLFVGIGFSRRIFRILSIILAIFLFFKILIVDFYRMSNVNLWHSTWNELISFLGVISMGTSYCIGRYFNYGKIGSAEKNSYNVFSSLSVIYLTMFIWLFVDWKWLTFSLSLEALGVFICGILLLDKPLRLYSLGILLIVFFRFDNYFADNELIKWVVLSVKLLTFYTMYFLYKKLKDKSMFGVFEKAAVNAIFIAGTLTLVHANYRYILSSWRTLSLGLSGVILFLTGFLSRDKIFRIGGFVMFILAILRVVFVDLQVLPIIYKIISFIMLGILFLAISYIYTRYNVTKTKER